MHWSVSFFQQWLGYIDTKGKYPTSHIISCNITNASNADVLLLAPAWAGLALEGKGMRKEAEGYKVLDSDVPSTSGIDGPEDC